MEQPEFSSFGAWLRMRRRALDLTQDELARTVGCAKGTVRKWEADELRPSKQLAEALAERLGIAVAEQEAFVSFARGGAASRSQPSAPAPGLSPWRVPPQRRSNLPHTLTSFVGRTRELAELQRLFSTTRLLTMTGTGGIGKTRLALQFAGALLDHFPAGVWLAEFAPLTSPGSVPHGIAAALGVHISAGIPPADMLINHLRAKELLLVLDNCEHLLQPIAQLAEMLLSAAPSLKIIATSREALGIRGEVQFQVPPLAAPRVPMLLAASSLQPDAVHLFMDRARLVQPALALTGETAPLIAAICMRLDGIPLAIELAAARLGSLSLEQISTRLDDRFRLLTSGSRTSLPRQQTLQATLEWSYALLSETERVLFSRLSVFAGGWTLAATEAVCADERIPASDILDTLSHLVDKSLVLADALHGEPRYRMLETTRQYAGDRALESSDLARGRDRHLAFFLRVAEESERHLKRSEQVAWLDRLETDHDNLRAALDWSRRAAKRAESGLRLAAALGLFWVARGYFTEGLEHLEAALANAPDAVRIETRAKGLYSVGLLAYMQGDYHAARSTLGECISIYRRQKEDAGRRGLGHALIMLGVTESEVANYERAFILTSEGLEIMRALQDLQGIGRALWQLGACAVRVGAYAQALQRFEEALPLLRRVGDKANLAITLSGMAEVAVRQGDYERASRVEQESMTLRRELGSRWGIAVSLGNLGWIALLRDDLQRASLLLAESLTLRREIGDSGGIAWCLEKMAEIALVRGTRADQLNSRVALRRATQLFAAAAALRMSIGSMIDAVDRPAIQRRLDFLRAQLDATTFDALWAEGFGMPLEQAIASALALAES